MNTRRTYNLMLLNFFLDPPYEKNMLGAFQRSIQGFDWRDKYAHI